jgi:hypothetical protein
MIFEIRIKKSNQTNQKYDPCSFSGEFPLIFQSILQHPTTFFEFFSGESGAGWSSSVAGRFSLLVALKR